MFKIIKNSLLKTFFICLFLNTGMAHGAELLIELSPGAKPDPDRDCKEKIGPSWKAKTNASGEPVLKKIKMTNTDGHEVELIYVVCVN